MHKRLICGLLLCWSGFSLAGNWPQWRGPYWNGSADEIELPAHSDQFQILWKTPLPGPGSATPVVWGNHVFLTASDMDSGQVLAVGIEAITGHIRWTYPLGSNKRKPGNNDQASPSPVTDGQHVWFLAGNGMLVSLNMEGKPVWQRNLAEEYGEFVVFFGYSSSPLLLSNRLYIPVLQNEQIDAYGYNPDQAGPADSYLLILDAETGKTLHRQIRDTDAVGQSRESYITPIPFENEGKTQIILAGGECVTGHDPNNGTELWRWWFTPRDRQKLQHNVPSPVAYKDLLFVIRPEHRPLYAIRPTGSGQLTDAHTAWIFEENRSWISTPLVYRNRLYVLQEQEKELLCMDPQTGDMIWRHELPVTNALRASPAGGRTARSIVSA